MRLFDDLADRVEQWAGPLQGSEERVAHERRALRAILAMQAGVYATMGALSAHGAIQSIQRFAPGEGPVSTTSDTLLSQMLVVSLNAGISNVEIGISSNIAIASGLACGVALSLRNRYGNPGTEQIA